MPSDKLMKLFIIQTISSFVSNDYDSGMHFLKEIKQTYAENMSRMNPTLKNLAKEIIQSVDLFNPDGSGFMGGAFSNAEQEPMNADVDDQPQMPNFDDLEVEVGNTSVGEEASSTTDSPKSVATELQDLLDRRRAKRSR